jgi:hypothetical protein
MIYMQMICICNIGIINLLLIYYKSAVDPLDNR